ncbi:flagellar motor switch phosphatase FliY, partial [Pectinatus haikarae]|uniref:flagellar motor switch phosphatase FliY n=1 Tax=Pectinatus haikarae TaxID=349096 RepID=UPI0018C683B0
MADGMLSQEEIDALTKGIAPDTPQETDSAAQADLSSSSDETQNNEALTDVEKDTLGEIGNISMGSAATTLSMLLGHKVSITTPNVSIETMADIKTHYPMPYLIVGVSYTTGITGNNILAIQAGDAAIIADLMMGGDGTNVTDELDEIRQSAVSEAMNQMMGSVSTSLSQIFNKKIDISPPQVHMV